MLIGSPAPLDAASTPAVVAQLPRGERLRGVGMIARSIGLMPITGRATGLPRQVRLRRSPLTYLHCPANLAALLAGPDGQIQIRNCRARPSTAADRPRRVHFRDHGLAVLDRSVQRSSCHQPGCAQDPSARAPRIREWRWASPRSAACISTRSCWLAHTPWSWCCRWSPRRGSSRRSVLAQSAGLGRGSAS